MMHAMNSPVPWVPYQPLACKQCCVLAKLWFPAAEAFAGGGGRRGSGGSVVQILVRLGTT